MKPSNPAGPNVNAQTSSKGRREAAAYGQAGAPPGSISSSEELIRERSSEPTAVFCVRICILARSPSESCAESGSEKHWPGALLWVGRASPLAQPEGICRHAGDAASASGSGRSPGGGNGNPPQYSCLENPMDRGAWWATFHGAAKSQTWLSTQYNRLKKAKQDQAF